MPRQAEYWQDIKHPKVRDVLIASTNNFLLTPVCSDGWCYFEFGFTQYRATNVRKRFVAPIIQERYIVETTGEAMGGDRRCGPCGKVTPTARWRDGNVAGFSWRTTFPWCDECFRAIEEEQKNV